MSTVQRYLRESDNAVLFDLDDSGNIIQLGNTTQNSGATGTSAAAGVAASSYPAVSRVVQELSLTATNLKALRATPMLLIAAPGAGKYIKVISYDLLYTFLTTAFTNTTATLKLFQGTTANGAALTADLSALLLNTASKQENGTAPIDLTDTNAHMQNVGIFAGNDGAAEILAGLGSLKIVIDYLVVTF